jgi:hypothetical protein
MRQKIQYFFKLDLKSQKASDVYHIKTYRHGETHPFNLLKPSGNFTYDQV